MARKKRFYVYRIFDRHETVYIGKGSGRRLQCQKSKFGLPGEILEEFTSEQSAFDRERHWIAELRPTENKCPGGYGGRCGRKREPKRSKIEIAMERIGPRKYIAKFLLRKLDELNCEMFGVSKVDLFRLREVANGPRV